MAKSFLLSALLALPCGSLLGANALVQVNFNSTDGSGVVISNTGTSTLPTFTTGYGGGYRNYGDEAAGKAVNGFSYNSQGNSVYAITTTLNNAISFANSFTVAFSVNPSSFPTSAWTNLFTLGNSTDYLRIQNPEANSGKIGLWGNGTLSADPIALNTSNSQLAISTLQFSQISLVYDATASGGFFSLYVNGQKTAFSRNAFSTSASGPLEIKLGGGYGGSYSGAYFDNFAIYDAALTPQEIQDNLVAAQTAGADVPLTINQIPEPSTASLSLVALSALLIRRRRKA